MANYKCVSCGTIFDDPKGICPKCGCLSLFVNKVDSTNFVNKVDSTNSDNDNSESSKNHSRHIDSKILNHGRSTRAESIICELAEKIVYWGDITAVIVSIILAITTMVSSFSIMDTSPGYGFMLLILGALKCVITYYVIKYLAKIIWAVLRLFVNISTTLKRIEIFLESNKTNISE